VQNRIYKATGISQLSLDKIQEEGKNYTIYDTDLCSEPGPSLSSPVKNCNKPSPITDSDKFDKDALRRLIPIYDFHGTEKLRVGSQLCFKGQVTNINKLIHKHFICK
jgi:hypothetical protein